MKRRIFSLLFVVMFIVTSLSGQLGGMAAKAADTKPTIWVVGDSTVSSFTDNYYYPRYGYGTQIGAHLRFKTLHFQEEALRAFLQRKIMKH